MDGPRRRAGDEDPNGRYITVREFSDYKEKHAESHTLERHAFRNEMTTKMGDFEQNAQDDDRTLAARINSLELWRAEIRGAFSLARFAAGTSILAALASLFSVWRSLQ